MVNENFWESKTYFWKSCKSKNDKRAILLQMTRPVVTWKHTRRPIYCVRAASRGWGAPLGSPVRLRSVSLIDILFLSVELKIYIFFNYCLFLFPSACTKYDCQSVGSEPASYDVQSWLFRAPEEHVAVSYLVLPVHPGVSASFRASVSRHWLRLCKSCRALRSLSTRCTGPWLN